MDLRTVMRIRQSDIKTFQECALKWKFQHVDRAIRSQSSALSFGTVIHVAVEAMEVEDSLDVGVTKFTDMWDNLGDYGLEYEYLLPRNTHASYRELGLDILRNWWSLIKWDTDVVIAREHSFVVPIGDGHELEGTPDKVAVRTIGSTEYLLIPDYKTSARKPTRNYLNHDLQFTAYAYATTQPEFWEGIEDGMKLFEHFKDTPRAGEMVFLRTPERIFAGERNEVHYNRLRHAVNAIADSIDCGIFVPTITGESCQFCDFREPCGIEGVV
jgi:CRISPR/Cas system-associated exonuclease Cas4 (RecB family)